jgi:hypothetical protein
VKGPISAEDGVGCKVLDPGDYAGLSVYVEDECFVCMEAWDSPGMGASGVGVQACNLCGVHGRLAQQQRRQRMPRMPCFRGPCACRGRAAANHSVGAAVGGGDACLRLPCVSAQHHMDSGGGGVSQGV